MNAFLVKWWQRSWLAILSDHGVLPPRGQMGVLLAGDLYADPDADQLGVSGDVWPVWSAFWKRFRWVCGVAGNHDRFGAHVSPAASSLAEGMHFIDSGQVDLDGLRVGGVGGIIGKAGRPQRHTEVAQRGRHVRALSPTPQVLIMHEGPDVPVEGLRGRELVREMVDGVGTLVVSGH
ncbi:MAG TPA: metallophosphoesterase, partial [Candidatus Xenobia bacterium]